VNDIERAILRWLEERNDSWHWFFGRERLDKKTTVERFRKDKAFRKLVVEQVTRAAIEMFESHLRKEGKL
jgi:hypothetical protein